MKTIHIFIVFILVAAAQLILPAQMIFNQENILKTGTAFKFKTQPVDPSNPFKGKYIYLNFEANTIKTIDSTWSRHEPVFVSVVEDSLGFAMVDKVTRAKPIKGNFINAKVSYYSSYDKTLRLDYPFNEFYMNETKAYDAEIAHANAQNDSIPNNTYALVFIKEGQTVLDNVFIDEIPIADYVE